MSSTPTPTQLLVRKKITAIYADGSSKMNLGIATVVRMLKGSTNVPVEVAADAAARKLLAELAASAGRTVERAAAGTFLTSPAKQPDREPQAVPVVPTAPVGPKPRRTRGNGKVKSRAVRKYPTLSSFPRLRRRPTRTKCAMSRFSKSTRCSMLPSATAFQKSASLAK
jgi:hypothetical protein